MMNEIWQDFIKRNPELSWVWDVLLENSSR